MGEREATHQIGRVGISAVYTINSVSPLGGDLFISSIFQGGGEGGLIEKGAHLMAHPRCKNLLPSRVTQNKDNKEVKTKDRMNIIVTKQRKTLQVLTLR